MHFIFSAGKPSLLNNKSTHFLPNYLSLPLSLPLSSLPLFSLPPSLHLCSFSELPECQLPIASQPEVMRQTVCMALSPTYPCPTKALASEVLLCLAHTPATHQFLATDFVISSMIKMLTEEPNKADTTPNALVGLRCVCVCIQHMSYE